MSLDPRGNDFSVASAASASNEQFVGNSTKVYLYLGDISVWNVGAGNVVFSLKGAYASGVTHVPIPGATITTTGSGIFPMTSAAGVPYLSIKLGTATTSNATIHLITSND